MFPKHALHSVCAPRARTQCDPLKELLHVPPLPAAAAEHACPPSYDRTDVVWDRGMLHLVHDDVTPEQARIADLLLVADALRGRGRAASC